MRWVPGKDEEGFNLVDNRQLPNKTMSRGKGPGKGKHKGIQANYQEGILGQNKKQVPLPVKGKGKGTWFLFTTPSPPAQNRMQGWESEWRLDLALYRAQKRGL